MGPRREKKVDRLGLVGGAGLEGRGVEPRVERQVEGQALDRRGKGRGGAWVEDRFTEGRGELRGGSYRVEKIGQTGRGSRGRS